MSASACSLGPLLLQPQGLKRAAGLDPEEALVEDLLGLASRIAADAVRGGTILTVLEQAVEAMGTRFLQGAAGGLQRAENHLRSLVEPAIRAMSDLARLLPDSQDPAQVIGALLPPLSKLADTVSGLSIDQLRSALGGLLDVLQQDLGLSASAVEAQVWALYDDVIARLEAVQAEADGSVRANRLAVIDALKRIRRRTYGIFSFPELNADRLATAMFDELKRGGLAAVLERIACAGKETGAALSLTEDILSVIPFTGFGSQSLGAAEASSATPTRRYLWYASWLLGDQDLSGATKIFGNAVLGNLVFGLLLPFHPLDGELFNADFSVDEDGHVRRRDQVIFTASDMDWTAVPGSRDTDPKLRYTFGHISAEAMEGWARHTAYAANFLEGLLHVARAASQKSHFLGNTFDAIFDVGHGAFKLGKNMPPGFAIFKGAGMGVPGRLLATVPNLGATIGGSFEGGHSKASAGKARAFWMTLYLSDVLSAFTYSAMAGSFRDLFLSVFTLINYEGPKDPPDGPDDRPGNRSHIDGVVGPCMVLFSWLMVKALPREDYARPGLGDGGHEARMWLLYMLLGGLGFGFMGGLLGTTVGEVIAWAEDWSLLGMTLVKSMARMVLLFWVTLYNFGENDTGGGTYNPKVGSFDSPKFNGYPDHSASPYALPWEKDRSILCVQGNQGMFSHNAVNPAGAQVYAYDFCLDQDDEILAARPGTVVDYFDWVPDDQNVQTSLPQTTLSADVPAGATSIPVASAAGFPTSGVYAILVDSEIMAVTGGQGTGTWAVARGIAGGPPAAHASGTAVTLSALGAGQTTGDIWNCIVVRHDQGDDPTPDRVHDRGGGGNPVTSYAVYGHGRTNSVRAVFAQRNVAPAAIIGTVVRQGQPIMLADSTGISFCNHVHIEVRPGPAPPPSTTLSGAIDGAASAIGVASFSGFPASGLYVIAVDSELMTVTGGQGTATWNVRRGMAGTAAVPHSTGATVRTIGPVMRTSLSGPTIPFVFREVSSLNPFADQGVPKSLTWYTSQNQRTP